jgi:hypothetical protein
MNTISVEPIIPHRMVITLTEVIPKPIQSGNERLARRNLI